MPHPTPAQSVRSAKLFHTSGSQAVGIPAEFEFTCNRVLIRKDGDRLIIEPLADLLDTVRTMPQFDPEDDIPDDIDSTLLPLRDIDL